VGIDQALGYHDAILRGILGVDAGGDLGGQVDVDLGCGRDGNRRRYPRTRRREWWPRVFPPDTEACPVAEGWDRDVGFTADLLQPRPGDPVPCGETRDGFGPHLFVEFLALQRDALAHRFRLLWSDIEKHSHTSVVRHI
jgi:hypothetical protein